MMEELDMYALCRICLEQSYFKCDIFKTCSIDGYLVYDVINAVCELEVSPDDGLPQFLCSECLRKVMDFKLFKTKAHQGRSNFLLMKEQMENAITRQDVDINCCSNDAISLPEGQPNEMGMQAEIKQEEVDIDCSSVCEISIPVEQNNENGTQANHGPIPLKYEVLPFNRDANQQESEVDCDGVVLQNIEGNKDLPQDCQDGDIGADQEKFESSTTVRRQIRKNNMMKCRKLQVKSGRNEKVVVNHPSEVIVLEDVRKFECMTCRKGFNNIVDLRRHKLLHVEGKTFECNESRMRFNLRSNLVKHTMKHVVDKPNECYVCEKTFKDKFSLANHSRVHTLDKPFKCKDCGKRFNQKGNLMSHLKWHTGNKLFECNECGKRFHQKGNLVRHSRVHTGLKPFECKECGKKYACKYYFYIHSRVHTGSKPFECKNCGKGFTQKSNLLIHSRLHTGQKPFECKKCTKTFNQKASLLKHSCLYRTETLLSKGMQEIQSKV